MRDQAHASAGSGYGTTTGVTHRRCGVTAFATDGTHAGVHPPILPQLTCTADRHLDAPSSDSPNPSFSLAIRWSA